jgi:hypothetical protein
VYAVEEDSPGMFVGQQVDVFIDSGNRRVSEAPEQL